MRKQGAIPRSRITPVSGQGSMMTKKALGGPEGIPNVCNGSKRTLGSLLFVVFLGCGVRDTSAFKRKAPACVGKPGRPENARLFVGNELLTYDKFPRYRF